MIAFSAVAQRPKTTSWPYQGIRLDYVSLIRYTLFEIRTIKYYYYFTFLGIIFLGHGMLATDNSCSFPVDSWVVTLAIVL